MNANISFVHNRRFMNDSTTIAGESQELVGVLQNIVQNAGALLGVRNCSIALKGETGTTLITLAALLPGGQKPRHTRFRLNEGVAGWVAAQRETVVIPDATLDPRFKQLGSLPVGSMICVPLIENGNLIGTLTASSQEIAAFDEEEARMFEIFAKQAAQTIVHARHAEVTQRQANQLEMLLRLSRDITARLEPDALYHAILSTMRQLVSYDSAIMYLSQEDTHELYPIASLSGKEDVIEEDREDRERGGVKASEEWCEKLSLYDATSLPVWAALHRHPMLWAPLRGEEVGGERGDEAELAAPLIARNMLYGVLSLKRAKPFSSQELRLIRNLCTMAASAFENMELFSKIRSEQEELSALLSASTDGIAMLDGNGCFIRANAAFGELFGIEQVVGMECLELFGCRDEEGGGSHCRDLCLIQQALQRREPLPYVEIDLQIQEAQRSIGLSITPVTTIDKPLCVLIARDVTVIRDMTRMKAKFLSMITHELRSPINAINGYLDLTLEGIAGELSEQQREFVQRARAGSEHLYALVEDLLLVSRADAGQLKLSRDIIRLQDVIVNAVEEMELTASDNGIEILVEIERDFPRLYADAVRLQQVLRNLLSNALCFTAQGGQVTVAAHVVNKSLPEGAGIDEAARVVELRVRDTGAGIALENQQRIFERFFQVKGGRGRSSGQGLGLAIVKMVVELHGGSVTVESIPGEGSTFICTLPCLLT